MPKPASYWDKITRSRVSRRRALQMAGVGGATAGAIWIVGCGGDDDNGNGGGNTPGTGDNGNGEVVTGGTFRGSVSLVLGKDPHKASTFLTHALASQAYSRLLRFKTTTGELDQNEWYTTENELASQVETPDDTTYAFTIRDDATFQNVPPVNGRKVTGEDVVYSFNRYREISPNKANMNMVESVTADGQTVTFKLKEPFGLFRNRIASFQDLWIMPREFVEQSDTASEDSMLGSGPFIFESLDATSMRWRKNPDYWETDDAGNKLPYLDGVQLDIITDQNQTISQFAAGALDSIFVPPTLRQSVESGSPDAVLDGAARNILSFLYFEPASFLADKPPFNDERVRQGMSMAIDRNGLLQRINQGLDEPGEWPNLINAGFGESWWLNPRGDEIGDAGRFYEYNLDEAMAMFRAAGVGDGFDTPMHFSSTTYTTIVPYYDIVRNSLPSLLREVSVNVQERPEEYGVYISKTFGRGEFEGFTFGLESVFSDVAAYWTNMFYPRDAGGGRNHSSIDDPQLRDRIASMLQIQDLDELRDANLELQKYTSEVMWYVPVVTPIEFTARQPRLKNVQNTTGPTTYATGTEGYLKLMKDA